MGDGAWFQFFQVAQSIVMMLAALLAWFWGRQQQAERRRQLEHEANIDERIERINEQLSGKLLPVVQALIGRVDRMPEDLRQKFLPLDRAMDLIDESRRDRAALWAEFERRGGRGAPL